MRVCVCVCRVCCGEQLNRTAGTITHTPCFAAATVPREYLALLLNWVPPPYGSVIRLPQTAGNWRWTANNRTVTLRLVAVQWHPALPTQAPAVAPRFSTSCAV